MNLSDLQSDFQRIMLKPDCTGADWVSEPVRDLSSKDRLNIYHNAYRLRLIDALMDTFEHTAVYLGDDWFNALASDFVQSHQSIYTNIGLYGEEFPDYLADKLGDDLDVSELAQMDWKLRRAFDGPESAVLTRDDLQQLVSGTSDFQISAVPTLSITTQHFNTLDIWHAINQEEPPPEAKPHPDPVDVLIWRKGHSPHFRSLSGLEPSAIRQIIDGRSLDELGATLARDYPEVDVAIEFGLILHRWLEDEVVCKSFAHEQPAPVKFNRRNN